MINLARKGADCQNDPHLSVCCPPLVADDSIVEVVAKNTVVLVERNVMKMVRVRFYQEVRISTANIIVRIRPVGTHLCTT